MKWRWMVMLLLLMTVPVTALAKDGSGSIRLKMAYDGEPVAGGTVTLYDVSDSPEGVGPLEMLVYVRELGIPGTEKPVDASGFVTFGGLKPGLYLLVQQKAAPGFYPVNPFLVRLPQKASGIQSGDIEAAPKLEPEKKLPQTGQLIWPAWALLGSGIMFVGIGILAWKRE